MQCATLLLWLVGPPSHLEVGQPCPKLCWTIDGPGAVSRLSPGSLDTENTEEEARHATVTRSQDSKNPTWTCLPVLQLGARKTWNLQLDLGAPRVFKLPKAK